MAAEGDVDLDLEAEENCTGKPAEKPRKHDSGAADLERVTDYAEEKEISSSDLETAMSVIGDRRSREQKAKQEREKELAKVTIKKEDVELIHLRVRGPEEPWRTFPVSAELRRQSRYSSVTPSPAEMCLHDYRDPNTCSDRGSCQALFNPPITVFLL
ncbi:huntingtin-interacting protein K isoform 1-T1 [Aulostomus maculatus]